MLQGLELYPKLRAVYYGHMFHGGRRRNRCAFEYAYEKIITLDPGNIAIYQYDTTRLLTWINGLDHNWILASESQPETHVPPEDVNLSKKSVFSVNTPTPLKRKIKAMIA